MAFVDAHEEREIAIVNIQNAFIQTENPQEVVDQGYIMKIRVKLAQILAGISP